MSSEQNFRPDESSGGASTWDDERITAYVMGELPPEETAAFESEMSGNEELARAVEQAREVADKLAGFYASMPTTTLDADRREKIAGAANVDTHRASTDQTPNKRFVLWAVAASILLIGLALPAMMSRPGMQTAMKSDLQPVASSQLESEEIAQQGRQENPGVVDEEIGSVRAASEADSSGMRPFSEPGEIAGDDVSQPMNFANRDRSVVESRTSGKSVAVASNEKGEPVSTGPSMEMGMGAGGMATEAMEMPMLGDSGMSMGGNGPAQPRSRRGMGMDMMDMDMDDAMEGMEMDMMMSGAAPVASSAPVNRPQDARRSDIESRDQPAMALASPMAEADEKIANDEGFSRLSKNPMVKPQSAVASSEEQRGGKMLSRTESKKKSEAIVTGERPLGMVPPLPAPSHPAENSSLDMMMPGLGTGPGSSGDKFSPIDENEFRRVSEHPLSTLSIDVDTASYSKVRSYLQRNQLPRPDSVRIEEMVNYFDYDYSGPSSMDGEPSDPFAAAMTATVCPWEPKHRLVRVGLQAKTLTEKERPRCNLVFLIDTSGSMSSANKLPLVIDGMKVLLKELKGNDQVAIVVYAGSAGLVLDSTPVKNRKKILRALTQLRSGGSTNGGAGLQLAYDTARDHFIKDGVNRVILCSDGDFNVGMTGTDQLVREARKQAKSGIDLTVLGFGIGNHNDAMMEKISNDAEGNYAFVDTIGEARKVLSDQLTGTLVTVAKDVKIQIEFNPAVVSAYRLIGYENRVLAKEDFNDDTKDAGEIGAGHRVTAFYEVVPAGTLPDAVAPAVDPLKYQPAPNATAASDEGVVDDDASGEESTSENTMATQDDVVSTTEMLTLKLRYKPPQGDTSTLMTRVLDNSQLPFSQADVDFRFAAAVAAFGMQLRGSEFAGSWTYDDVLRVAQSATGEDTHGLRSELVELVRKARELTVSE
ncbi:YfbK domain-containing protein [Aporhodopirellula aestuarii]|uniref:von Willebrand factor type A domain-containing protein n=1 Tax=Aporhodopirellula aestuarii TaxID=2950107 RepID=A0ABT0TYZ6_9BACT|nr:von Willebrand factor type A domain-containing protein [Aporhodopirellula aestuarii]MCM2369785.1 von Willebrand factor type A domain-containing protein [Aporhodopirellula aestuarii]